MTTYYDILQKYTTYYDILGHITTYYDILRHITTSQYILQHITTIEKSLDVYKDTEGDNIKIKKAYTAGKTEAPSV